MENIRYGRLDATDEEVFEAAKRANIHDYILTLENGYNTQIGEKIQEIKDAECLQDVRDLYLGKKNNNEDPNKKSRSIFVETINEIYNSIENL